MVSDFSNPSGVEFATPAKSDVSGRLRVAAVLRGAGIESPIVPERIAGSTNEVWRTGDYVVRVCFEPDARRLRREARLSHLLPAEVQYPRVIASGAESFGEWIVQRYYPSTVLSAAWSAMNIVTRKSIVVDLAHSLRALHRVRLDAAQTRDLALPLRQDPPSPIHHLPASLLLPLIDRLRQYPHIDHALLDETARRVMELAVALPDEIYGLVHGDLHFENVLVRDGVLVAMLDFEWSRTGPPEIDIDVLARFCAEPQLHVTGSYPVNRMDYRPVLGWIAEAYPELFDRPSIVERLTLTALAFEIPALVCMPPSRRYDELPPTHPINRLRLLLDYGPHAVRLGWQ